MTLAAETVAETVRSRIGSTAFTNHPHPFDESELPAWRVTYEDDEHESVTLSGSIVQHRLPIKVQGNAMSPTDVLGALNEMSAIALPLIFAAPVPYGLEPAGEIRRELESDGQAHTGSIEIPLRAMYFTTLIDPETIL
jgi:hypothetical protein